MAAPERGPHLLSNDKEGIRENMIMTDPRDMQRGFTLIELMIVIAIVGILASVAIPAYETYAARSRFSEVVLAASAYKSASEVAVQMGRATGIGDLDAGANGIPANNTGLVGQYVGSVTMNNGVITAASQNLPSDSTYTLTATLNNGGIRWSEGGACISAGLC